MGFIEKTKAGTYRAHAKRKGYARRSRTWTRKSDAEKWIRQVESKMDTGDELPSIATDTVEAVIRRYIQEECVGADKKWDKLRLEAFLKQNRHLAKKAIARTTHEDFEHWVDKRKKVVKEATALRELNVVSGVFTHAIKRWRMKIPRHPTKGMTKPQKGKPRTRRPNQDELKTLYECRGGANQYTNKWYVLWMFELEIETGMRIGEMVLIKPHNLHLDEHWVHLPKTKNGDARDVPLSPRAAEILELMMARPGAATKGPFPVKKSSLDTVWRATCKDLGIEDLHFHDGRHEACTRLARKFEVLDLAKIIGHRDLKSLMIYYNPTAHELAARMRPTVRDHHPGDSAATPAPPRLPTEAC
jgi:integrase